MSNTTQQSPPITPVSTAQQSQPSIADRMKKIFDRLQDELREKQLEIDRLTQELERLNEVAAASADDEEVEPPVMVCLSRTLVAQDEAIDVKPLPSAYLHAHAGVGMAPGACALVTRDELVDLDSIEAGQEHAQEDLGVAPGDLGVAPGLGVRGRAGDLGGVPGLSVRGRAGEDGGRVPRVGHGVAGPDHASGCGPPWWRWVHVVPGAIGRATGALRHGAAHALRHGAARTRGDPVIAIGHDGAITSSRLALRNRTRLTPAAGRSFFRAA